MKTVRLTMAQALVRFLENQYIEVDGEQSRFVRGVFIIPGHGNVVGLGQALSQEAKHLEIWHGQNEQGMAQAAVAFAKQMKRKQICVATSSVGPGAANMVTACGTATANNIPLLVLPGDVYACRQPDPVLQQVEQTNNLSISTNDAFKAVCRYWDRIVRPEQLMSAMISAFRVLTDPANTGAVCIAMPQDVEGEAYDYPESFFKKRVWRLERRPATEAALADAAEVIKKAKRPILVCGGGVRYSEAHEEFRAFAEATGIPFGETQAGKSAIEWTHPLNLGGLGVTGCSAANDIAKNFISGVKKMVYAGFLIGLASAISVIITDGQIIHTIIYYISMPLVLLPKTLAAVFMFLVNLVFNFFVSSASGQAAIVMPLMVPMADILEIPRQVAVLAYQYGDGFSNCIIPTSGVLMAALGVARVPFEKWLKFMMPLFLIWTLVGCFAVATGVLINLQ